jgi:hypothetical protein
MTMMPRNPVIPLALGIILLLVMNNVGISLAQDGLSIAKTVLPNNSFNLTAPIYQASSGKFLAAKDLSTSPFKVSEESFFEEAVMNNIGNVTNNMTFINSYLTPALVQAKGKGVIEMKDGGGAGQSIDWISSDLGTINSTGFYFYGMIHFSNATSEKMSYLNNTMGVYVETPEIKRTIWLVK